MPRFAFLHHHHRHRSRQLRWVLPIAAVILVGAAASAIVAYEISEREVANEFFRAHKTIHETGELLRTGLLVGMGVSVALVGLVATWSFRFTHRIVRPVHALHLALDSLAAGALGTRVEFHRNDEFQEVADALNRLASGLAQTIGRLETAAAELGQIERHCNAPQSERVGSVAAELSEILASFDTRATPPIRADGPTDAT